MEAGASQEHNTEERPATAKPRSASSQVQVFKSDEVLLELTGLAFGTRPEYVHAIWDYIKANNLQVPGNGRMIVADEAFARMTGGTPGEVINGFKLLSYMKGHFLEAPEG